MKNKKGFTLIELVTVFAILTVLAGISVPLVFTYLQTSRIMQYNDYAKTIYLSAQSYLTNERGAGQLSKFDDQTEKGGQKVSESMVEAGYFGGNDTYYLMQDKGAENPMLRAMLEQYISDPFIMEQSICVEYNSKTGSIYSVSYSELADGFFYNKDMESQGKRISISDRSEKARKELGFGYYSVQLLDAPPQLASLKPSAVQLFNEEQLYLKWSDAQPAGSSLAHNLTYTVKLQDAAAGGSAAPLVSIEVKAEAVKLKAIGIDSLGHYLVDCLTTSYDKNGAPLPAETQKHWIYRIGNEFFLVLDSIDTSANGGLAPTRGIAAAYQNIGSRKLRASVSAVGEGCRPNQETLSNAEHSLFASQTDKKTQVSRARHLFNLRYDAADLEVTQLTTLDWRKPLTDGMMVYNGELVKSSDAVNSDGTIKDGNLSAAFGTIAYLDSDGTVAPFSGSYEGGGKTNSGGKRASGDRAINGLYLTSRRAGDRAPTGETGLFAQNAGSIQNLNLNELTLRGGVNSTGAVAGSNTGMVDNIHVQNTEGSLGLTAEGESVGGIIGTNAGKITNCSTNSAVLGTSNVGGIVGLNLSSGEVIDCSTTGGSVTGASDVEDNDNVGGVVGKNEGKIEKCNSKGVVLGHSNIGGIVGLNAGDGTVVECDTAGGSVTGERLGAKYSEHIGGIIGKNEATVTAALSGYINVADVTGDRFVGGIIGSNDSGNIEKCSNSGFIWAKVEYGGGITGSNGTAGGKSGTIKNCVSVISSDLSQTELEARATGDYIGGIAGYNNGSVEGKSSESPALISGDVMGKNYVGGVIGHNDTKGVVRFCEVTGGSVVATEDFAGGFFGLNTSLHSTEGGGKGIELHSNPELVKGRHFVGGSIGANLVSVGDGASTLTISSINGKQGGNGRVEAQAFAGGVLGYGDVVPKGGDLTEALEVLKNIDPETYDPEEAADTSNVTTIISESRNFLNVTANRYVGGIIGMNSAASKLNILSCSNNGSLSVDTDENKKNPQGDESYYIGGITGRNSKSGRIEKCVNGGEIKSLSKYTGGIAEVNNGIIIECNNAGIVRSTKDHVGGIVGFNGETNPAAEVTDCNALVSSEVHGRAYLGGLVGENAGIIKNCTFAGKVEGKNSGDADLDQANFVGGIVGLSAGEGSSLTNNKTLAGSSVAGHNYVGGLVGKNASATTMSEITNLAKVTGNNFVGGVVGQLGADGAKFTITDCINEGAITAKNSSGVTEVGGITGANRAGCEISDCENKGDVTGGGDFTGGIVSYNDGKLIRCYATGGTVTGARSAGGLVGLNQENGEITYEKKDEVASTDDVELKSNVKSEGKTGGRDTEYHLGGLMAKNESTTQTAFANYIFAAELRFISPSSDVTGTEYKQYAGGILAVNQENDTLEDCGFTGKIYGGNAGAGGIAGKNLGTVKNCAVGSKAALVSSKGITGGLIGECAAGSTEEKLTNEKGLEVQGTKWVGGFYGKYSKLLETIELTDVENLAKVSGTTNVGGIAGEFIVRSYTLTNCANRGTVTASGGGAAGGLVGYTLNLADGARFIDCVNSGTVEGKNSSKIGGLLGHSKGGSALSTVAMERCSNDKSVIGTNSPDIGGLIGYAEGKHSFTSCTNNGTVSTGVSSAGGIVGSALATKETKGPITFDKCRNMGTVSGAANPTIGGIAGSCKIESANAEAVKFTDCSNGTQEKAAALVQGDRQVGGILGMTVGANDAPTTLTIERCVNYGAVKGNKKHTGGIVGYLTGKGSLVTDCENMTSGKVTGGSDLTGGIVGQAQKNAAVKKCVNSGSVQGKSWAGGILGQHHSGNVAVATDGIAVDACVNKGTVGGAAHVGGIMGGLLGVGKDTKQVTVQNCTNLGTLTQAGDETGGIVGTVEQNAKVLNCVNGAKDDPAKGQISMAGDITGGIVGNLLGGSTVQNSTNYRSIQNAAVGAIPASTSGNRTGGIVGQMAQGLVEGCTNFGGIGQPKELVGGIVGAAIGSDTTLRNSFNHGEIKANKLAGGLVGSVTAATALIETSANYGAVTVMTSATDVGGLVGQFQVDNKGGVSFLQDSVNYGKVSGADVNMGGIVGYVDQANNDRGRTITVLRCANYGELDVKMNVGDMHQYGFGGIAGKVERFVTVDNCFNFGKITAEKPAANVGGIAGLLYRSSSTVQRSINSADIDAKEAGTVGGVVGLNHGTVISCQNTALELSNGTAAMKKVHAFADKNKPEGTTLPTPAGGVIAGDRDVGGIVGINEATAAEHSGMIYSEKSLETEDRAFDTVQNTMRIEAHSSISGQSVGGIVGNLRTGSVVGAVNTGDLEVFEHSGTIGGIAGSASWISDRIDPPPPTPQSETTLAGVFNLGELMSDDGFRGGIVGRRQGVDEGHPGAEDHISVKDAFFNKDDVPETSLSSRVSFSGRVWGQWRIGNEPEELVPGTTKYNIIGANDAVRDSGDGHLKSQLNAADFGTEFTNLTGKVCSDPVSTDDIKAFLLAYAPRLNAPNVLDVTIDPATGNAYTVTWDGGQGALSGYQLYYQIYNPDGTIKAGDIRESEKIGADDERKNAMSFPPELIGHFFTVGVKALGVVGEDGNSITLDSEVKYTEKRYLILPPMLTPQVTAENIGGTKYRFKITNLNDYKAMGKPSVDYPQLANIVDPPNQAIYDEAYKAYVNGLDKFYLFNKDQSKEDTTENPLVFTRQGDDYIAERSFDLGGKLEKTFNLYFTATPKVGNLPTYYVSNRFDMPLLVKQKLVLEQPQFNRMEYTGTLDEPSYTLHFAGVANAGSYKVVITLADGTQTLLNTTVTSGGVGSKTVTIPKNLLTDEWLGKGCTISLQSIPKNPEAYTESKVTSEPFTIISRLPEPVVTFERVEQTDKYAAKWQGTGKTYGVSVTQQTTGSAEPPKKLFPEGTDTTDATEHEVDYTYQSGAVNSDDAKITQGFRLAAQVQQLGKLGESLSSKMVTARIEVFPRLSQIGMPIAKSAEKNLLDWSFSWVPGTATAENSEGFMVYRTDTTPYELIGETEVGTFSLQHEFGEDDAGKTVSITVVAEGKPGVSSSSIWGESVTILLPSQPKPPENFAINPTPDANPMSAAEFEKALFTASWDKWNDSTHTISAYEFCLMVDDGDADDKNDIPVLDADGKEIREEISDLNKVSSEFKISAAYAGQKLKAKLRVLSMTTLNSKWTELPMVMPKVKLETPTLERTGDSGVIVKWEKIPYASGYRVSYGATGGTLATEDLGSDKLLFVLPPEANEFHIIALGDEGEKHYLNSEEVVWTVKDGVLVPEAPPIMDSGTPLKDSGPVPKADAPIVELAPPTEGDAASKDGVDSAPTNAAEETA